MKNHLNGFLLTNIKMKMRNVLVIGILLLIIIQFGFILAQEEGEIVVGSKISDICALENSPIGCGDELMLHGKNLKISENGDISFTGEGGKLIFNQGKPNQIVLEGTSKQIKITPLGEITFESGNADFSKLSINGNVFEASRGKIWLDQKTGEILETNFLSGGGTYNLNGNKFTIGKINDRRTKILYSKNKKELIFEESGGISELATIDSLNPPITLKGLFELNVLDKYSIASNLFVSEKGDYYAGKNTFVNTIRINEGSNIPLFFDGKEHESDYISFSDNKILFSTKMQPIKATFDKWDNFYLRFSEEVQKFEGTGSGGARIELPENSKVIFENRDNQGLSPKFILSNGVKLNEYEKTYASENGEIKIIVGGGGGLSKIGKLEIATLENPEKKLIIDESGTIKITENRNHNKETEKSREIPKK